MKWRRFVPVFLFAWLAFDLPAHARFLKFPQGFQWCVSTSAHQIEGHNKDSDWWDWERLPPACDVSGVCRCKIRNCETSGAACEHWNRLEEDTQLLADLGVSAYSFSVEWAKIEPLQGEWNQEAIVHYQREISLLREKGIEPIVKLHHFTLPRWLRARGGWEWGGAPEAFARFARLVITEIAPDAVTWITVNEPILHLSGGYIVGVTPPGLEPPRARADGDPIGSHGYLDGHIPTTEDFKRMVPALRGLLRAHAAAYHALHAAATRPIQVGITNYFMVFDPKRWFNPLDLFAAYYIDRALNWTFIKAIETGKFRLHIPFLIDIKENLREIAGTQDFIGVDYYTRNLVQFSIHDWKPALELSVRRRSAVSDMGWEIYPRGIYRVLHAVHREFPGKPILIAENGLADAADSRRQRFIQKHLSYVHRAIEDGIPVQGYCHWSLMDNFEWVEGFVPRFGLYEMDYATQTRRLRPSAHYFSRVVRDNGLDCD